MRGLKEMLGGKILKTGRRIRGLTQIEVATIYGVNVSTYKRWEKGTHAVTFDDVAAICDHVFKLPLAEVQQVATHA